MAWILPAQDCLYQSGTQNQGLLSSSPLEIPSTLKGPREGKQWILLCQAGGFPNSPSFPFMLPISICQARSHLLLRLGAWSWPQTLFWNSFWVLLLSFLLGTHSAPGGCHRGILEFWILAGSFSSEALGAFGAVCWLVVGVFWSVTISTFPGCFNWGFEGLFSPLKDALVPGAGWPYRMLIAHLSCAGIIWPGMGMSQ